MFQLTRDSFERANRSNARVFASQPTVGDAVTAWPATTVLASNPTTSATTNMHTTAICTFGKRYERRLQELLT